MVRSNVPFQFLFQASCSPGGCNTSSRSVRIPWAHKTRPKSEPALSDSHNRLSVCLSLCLSAEADLVCCMKWCLGHLSQGWWRFIFQMMTKWKYSFTVMLRIWNVDNSIWIYTSLPLQFFVPEEWDIRHFRNVREDLCGVLLQKAVSWVSCHM